MVLWQYCSVNSVRTPTSQSAKRMLYSVQGEMFKEFGDDPGNDVQRRWNTPSEYTLWKQPMSKPSEYSQWVHPVHTRRIFVQCLRNCVGWLKSTLDSKSIMMESKCFERIQWWQSRPSAIRMLIRERRQTGPNWHSTLRVGITVWVYRLQCQNPLMAEAYGLIGTSKTRRFSGNTMKFIVWIP